MKKRYIINFIQLNKIDYYSYRKPILQIEQCLKSHITLYTQQNVLTKQHIDRRLLLFAILSHHEVAKYQTQKIQAAIIHINTIMIFWYCCIHCINIKNHDNLPRFRTSIDKYEDFFKHFKGKLIRGLECKAFRIEIEALHDKWKESEKNKKKMPTTLIYLQVNPPIGNLNQIRFQAYWISSFFSRWHQIYFL